MMIQLLAKDHDCKYHTWILHLDLVYKRRSDRSLSKHWLWLDALDSSHDLFFQVSCKAILRRNNWLVGEDHLVPVRCFVIIMAILNDSFDGFRWVMISTKDDRILLSSHCTVPSMTFTINVSACDECLLFVKWDNLLILFWRRCTFDLNRWKSHSFINDSILGKIKTIRPVSLNWWEHCWS